MRMHPKTLVLSWTPFFLVTGRVFAGSGLSHEDAAPSWTGFLETNTAETKLSQLNTSAFLENSAVTYEDSAEQPAPAAPSVPTEVAFEGGGVEQRKKKLSLPVHLQGLKVILGVLVCMGLLTAVLKGRAAPRKEDEDKKRKILAELQKVKALLPIAQRLAVALDTKVSRRLLEKLTTIVGKSDSEPEEKDLKKLETSLENALDALQMLQRAALREAEAIVEADRSVPGLTTLGFPEERAEEVLRSLGERGEPLATRPTARTYHSLLKTSAALPERIRFHAEKLSSMAPFTIENESVLVSTAAHFEALRSATASRKRLARLGQNIGDSVIQTIKLRLEGFREHALLDIEGDFQVMEVRHALGKNAAADEAPQPFPLDELETDLEEVRGLLSELRSNLRALGETKTLDDATTASGASYHAERKARQLLTKWFERENWLTDCPRAFDPESRAMLMRMAESNLESVRKEDTRLRKSLEKVRDLLKDDTEEKKQMRPDVLSEFLYDSLVEKAKSYGHIAWDRTKKTAAEVEKIKEQTDVVEALESLTVTSVNSLYQVLDRGKLAMSELSAQLVEFLGDDVQHNVSQAELLASQVQSLSPSQIDKYNKLRKQFDAAKDGIRDAQTLLETAEGAAAMRASLMEMQELVSSSSE